MTHPAKFLTPDTVGIDRLVQADVPLIASAYSQRVWSPQLQLIAGVAVGDNTAYFVYLGRTIKTVTPKWVRFFVTAAAVGTVACEVGLFSSPVAPQRNTPTLTKIVAGDTDVVTSTGTKGNATVFSTSVPAGTHLFAGLRCTATTTRPSVIGVTGDCGEGYILAKTTAGALTASSSFSSLATYSTVTSFTAWEGPLLRVSLD